MDKNVDRLWNVYTHLTVRCNAQSADEGSSRYNVEMSYAKQKMVLIKGIVFLAGKI